MGEWAILRVWSYLWTSTVHVYEIIHPYFLNAGINASLHSMPQIPVHPSVISAIAIEVSSKWLPWKFYFCCTFAITRLYVVRGKKLRCWGITNVFKHLAQNRAKLIEVILAPLGKWNSFNSKKNMKEQAPDWQEKFVPSEILPGTVEPVLRGHPLAQWM